MTHPLEELAKWHDDKAANDAASFGDLVNAIPMLQAQLDRHRRFAAAIRSAITDCECGELVRERLALLPFNKEGEDHFSIELNTYNGATTIFSVKEAPSMPYEETDRTYTVIGSGPTLSAAVAAAKGTP